GRHRMRLDDFAERFDEEERAEPLPAIPLVSCKAGDEESGNGILGEVSLQVLRYRLEGYLTWARGEVAINREPLTFLKRLFLVNDHPSARMPLRIGLPRALAEPPRQRLLPTVELLPVVLFANATDDQAHTSPERTLTHCELSTHAGSSEERCVGATVVGE